MLCSLRKAPIARARRVEPVVLLMRSAALGNFAQDEAGHNLREIVSLQFSLSGDPVDQKFLTSSSTCHMFAKQNGSPTHWAFRPGEPKQVVANAGLGSPYFLVQKSPGLLPGLKMTAVASRFTSRASYLQLIKRHLLVPLSSSRKISHNPFLSQNNDDVKKKVPDMGETTSAHPSILWILGEEAVNNLVKLAGIHCLAHEILGPVLIGKCL